ncbi:hypothetical protein T4B_775 [Trichinella pseudospiralis]|uniref:Uncharacterized protein n=2 Tax=Trichinella pseudospiralis TaxID=6337 RepID=A0A0V1FJH2_TRIPS|nr:hypothetical protein T4D_6897 [Trichinella pseudospiralis]KRZ26298.1 hypothetical protein T4B_775 [Trichinella pseudospiralis]
MLANDFEQAQNNSVTEDSVKRNETLQKDNDQLISLSVGIYHIIKDLNYVCIALGIIIVLTQGFASVAIICNNKLRRKRTFLLICMLCISWTIVAAGEICSAVATLVRYSLFRNCIVTQYNCYIEQTSLTAGLLLVIDTNLMTAVDRCLAIITPHWYRKQYKLWMVYMVILFSILHVFIARLQRFFNVSDILLPLCTALMDSSESVVKEQQIISNILLVITIILYFTMIILVKVKLKNVKQDRILCCRAKEQLKAKLLNTLALNTVSYAATLLFGYILTAIASSEKNIFESLKIARFASITFLNGIVTFLIFYFRIREFRVAMIQMLQKIPLLNTLKLVRVVPSEFSTAVS